MKSSLLLIMCTPLTVWGQITLTANDLPQPGTTYPLVDIAPPVLTDLEAAGPDATWDFSQVIALNDAPQVPQPMTAASATTMFIFNNPFNSAYQCDFFLPTELPDFGVDLSGIIPIDGFSNFYKTDGGAYTIAGIGLGAGGFDVPVPFADVDELFPLPLVSGTAFSSTSSIAMDIPETFGYWSDGTRDVVVDGWGTLILPDGPHDVLRVRTEINAHDSIYVPQIGTPFAFDRTQVVYQWYGQGHGFPLLEVNALFGIPTTARVLNLQTDPIAVEEASDEGWRVYPNPAAMGQHLLLAGDAGTTFEVRDAQGRVVHCGVTSSGVTHIPAPQRAGVYVVRCGDASRTLIVQ